MKLVSVAKRLCLSVIAVLLVASSFFLAAAPVAAESYTVKMGSDTGMLVFQPAKLAVKPGDTVKFVINKVPPHNVVFDDKTIPGGDKALAKSLSHKKMEMTAGQEIEVTIPGDAPAGDYTYYCEPHRGAGMVGKLTVQG